MEIVIRTRYINTFLVGFKSFLIFYLDRIKDLTVQVQSDKDDEEFIKMGKIYGFKVDIIFIDHNLGGNEWAIMLNRSLQYNRVISLDDDIIYLKNGFFDFIDEIKDSTNAKLIGAKYLTNNREFTIDSHFIYKCGDLNITENDFTDKASVKEFDGNDAGMITRNYKEHIVYIDDFIEPISNITSCYKNDYYFHVGGISCWYHNIKKNKEYLYV